MFFHRKADRFHKKIIKTGNVLRFRSGELKYSCGYPVIRLEGSWYEMGLQYGVLLRDEIQKLYGENNGRKAEIIKALPWYIRPFGTIIMTVIAGFSARRIPGKYMKELAGLSRGSGIAFNDMATAAFGGVIFDAACTSILARVDDGIIHAQNLDFEPHYLGKYPAIVEYNPPGGNRYINFGLAGVPGMFHGINEKGISLTVNYGDGTYNKNNRGLPMGYKLREILETASTLDDVENILKSHEPDELGWIITVCSAGENRGAVFDVFNREIVRSDFREKKYSYVLNRIFSGNRLGTVEYSKKYLQISRGEGIYNLARVESANRILRKHGIQNVDKMIAFLRNYDFYDHARLVGSMNTTIVNERTLHTIIFDWRDHSVYFASAPGYSSLSAIVKYNFDTSELVHYMDPAAEFNREEFRGFMDWYGMYQDTSIVTRVARGIRKKFPFIRFGMPDYSTVLESIDLSTYHNPRELWSLFRIWKTNRKAISFKEVISSCDMAVELHPDFAILYIILANIHKSVNNLDMAITLFEKALACRIISDYDRIHIFDELVMIYRKKGDRAMSLEYAVKNIRLIEKLAEIYCLGRIVGRIYDRMKYYAYKPARRYNLYHNS